MTETRAPFNGKKKEPAGVFVRLPLNEDQNRNVVSEMMFAGIPVAGAFVNALLAIGTPVTGDERHYEATVAHYEAKLAERDARIADLENALQGMIDLNLSGVTCIALARKVLKGPEA